MSKDELLRKWLSNDLSERELDEFKASEDFKLNQAILDGAQSFKASHFISAKTFEQFQSDIKKNKVPVYKLSQFKILTRIAAVVVISFGIYFSFFSNITTTIETFASQHKELKLPDASVVTLNAESNIAFNKKNWAQKREVLLDGEAFFKVAKGSKFDVKTAQGTVSVLGTQFTVKQRKNYFEVICFEGIVQVENNNKLHKLLKGNTYQFLNGNVSLDTIDKESPDWLNNISSFKSVSVFEVLKELERQYAISIVTEDIDTKRIFTGGFVHNDLNQALKSVIVPLNLEYRKESENKIILYKKKSN